MDGQNTKERRGAGLRALLTGKGRLALTAALGVGLILLGDVLFGGDKKAEEPAQTAADAVSQQLATERQLEERLAELIGSVEGAGRVRVMVTLENAGETVYALDEQTSTQAADAGEWRQSYQSEHVFLDAQNGREPLVETRLEPEVKGVAVVCGGGDDVTVVRRITELVSVVLGLPSNRVCVTKMIDTEEAS